MLTMKVQVKRKEGIPIYIQIKQQILEQIRLGKWGGGHRLPTERQLAQELSVSRNTVSMAYRELEAEGVLVSHQGRGTFVTATDQVIRREGNKERILKLIDLAIEEASELGFSIDDFVDIITERVQEKKTLMSQVKIAFIECNREQADFICKKLYLGAGVTITPVLLDQVLQGANDVAQLLNEADLVVTTFFHMEEMYGLLKEQKKLVGIALEPALNNIVRIARLYPAKPALLVCLTDNFAHSVKLSLEQCGIDASQLSYTITRDREELTGLIADVEVILTSPGRKKEVESIAAPHKEVIEFILVPDQGSISRLRSAVLELKKNLR